MSEPVLKDGAAPDPGHETQDVNVSGVWKFGVGVVIGAAFGSVVQAIVKDILNPIISAFGGEIVSRPRSSSASDRAPPPQNDRRMHRGTASLGTRRPGRTAPL